MVEHIDRAKLMAHIEYEMRQDLIKRLREMSMDFGELDHVSVLLLEAAEVVEELNVVVRAQKAVLDKLTAADVRPVVLCRDCLHSVKGKESLECERHRYAWNNLNRWVNDDDFCSWGVKREES